MRILTLSLVAVLVQLAANAMWPIESEDQAEEWLAKNNAPELSYQQLKKSTFLILAGREYGEKTLFSGWGSAFVVGDENLGYSNFHVVRSCIQRLERMGRSRDEGKVTLETDRTHATLNHPQRCQHILAIRGDRVTDEFATELGSLFQKIKTEVGKVRAEKFQWRHPFQWIINQLGKNPGYVNPNGVEILERAYLAVLDLVEQHGIKTTPVDLVSNFSEALSDRVNQNPLSPLLVTDSIRYDVVELGFGGEVIHSAFYIDPHQAPYDGRPSETLFVVGFPAKTSLASDEIQGGQPQLLLRDFQGGRFSLFSGTLTGFDLNFKVPVSKAKAESGNWIPTNSGASGGPLFDNTGRLHGVAVASGMEFLVPISYFVPVQSILDMYYRPVSSARDHKDH